MILSSWCSQEPLQWKLWIFCRRISSMGWILYMYEDNRRLRKSSWIVNISLQMFLCFPLFVMNCYFIPPFLISDFFILVMSFIILFYDTVFQWNFYHFFYHFNACQWAVQSVSIQNFYSNITVLQYYSLGKVFCVLDRLKTTQHQIT